MAGRLARFRQKLLEGRDGGQFADAVDAVF
jgi:hypothetical protein